jgi:hypothetical protein
VEDEASGKRTRARVKRSCGLILDVVCRDGHTEVISGFPKAGYEMRTVSAVAHRHWMYEKARRSRNLCNSGPKVAACSDVQNAAITSPAVSNSLGSKRSTECRDSCPGCEGIADIRISWSLAWVKHGRVGECGGGRSHSIVIDG